MLNEECSGAGGEAGAPPPAPVQPEPPEKGRVLKLEPDELVKLAPRLKSYLRRPDPTWPEIVDAAAFLRSDLGVSKSLWGEACLAMGRETGGDRDRHRLDQGPGAFPDHGRRVFPRHGGEGQGRRSQSRPDAVGHAPGRRAEAAPEDRPRGRAEPARRRRGAET